MEIRAFFGCSSVGSSEETHSARSVGPVSVAVASGTATACAASAGPRARNDVGAHHFDWMLRNRSLLAGRLRWFSSKHGDDDIDGSSNQHLRGGGVDRFAANKSGQRRGGAETVLIRDPQAVQLLWMACRTSPFGHASSGEEEEGEDDEDEIYEIARGESSESTESSDSSHSHGSD